MRIDLNSGVSLADGEASRTRGARRSEVGADANHADPVCTSNAATVHSYAASVLSAPEIRSNRVEALRQAVTNGTYEVSSARIAASVMEQLRIQR
jgi:flagellar biosynthesis anti-sigma factor FlgM